MIESLIDSFTNCLTLGKDLPKKIVGGSAMATISDGRGLILTHDWDVYSFHCDTPSQCFWKADTNYVQSMSRRHHLMFRVPASLVENCNTDINLPCPDDCTDPNQGTCDTTTGICTCYDGYTGNNCAGNIFFSCDGFIA